LLDTIHIRCQRCWTTLSSASPRYKRQLIRAGSGATSPFSFCCVRFAHQQASRLPSWPATVSPAISPILSPIRSVSPRNPYGDHSFYPLSSLLSGLPGLFHLNPLVVPPEFFFRLFRLFFSFSIVACEERCSLSGVAFLLLSSSLSRIIPSLGFFCRQLLWLHSTCRT